MPEDFSSALIPENKLIGRWAPETNVEALVYSHWWIMFHPDLHDPSETVRRVIYTDSDVCGPPPVYIPAFERMCADLKLPRDISRHDIDAAWAALDRALDSILLEACMLLAQEDPQPNKFKGHNHHHPLSQ
ncbi:hypothetical protein B0H21DRAFT_826185 [Amylocystis lapponica]|nr:hypothetical protein B0H21DRAFT_826185 [Amylocystis lapponica]